MLYNTTNDNDSTHIHTHITKCYKKGGALYNKYTHNNIMNN